MPDSAGLRAALKGQYPESWVEHHLGSFPAAYAARFDAEAVARHIELIQQLSDDHPVRVRAEPAGSPETWLVEVVGFDAFQFLSTLCSLLTVSGLSIVDGCVFTSEPPAEPAPALPARPGTPRRPAAGTRFGPPRSRPAAALDRRRKLVDVFRVERIAADSAGAPDWNAFQDELCALTSLLRAGKYDEVHHRLIGRYVAVIGRSRAPVGAGLRLEPIDVQIDPDGADFATAVRIRARDSLGFLSLTASALALCGIRIVQAEIQTSPDGKIDDTIWVTDRAGHKLIDEARLRELRLSLILIEHFSSLLPQASNPEAALKHFTRFATDTMSRPDWAEEFAALDRPEVLDALVRVLGESEFLWEDYLRDRPEVVLPLIGDPAEWDRPPTASTLAAELDAALAAAPDREARHRIVQRFKDREIFRADLRSILGRCGGEVFSTELTTVAEVLMAAALRLADAEARPPAPQRRDGRPAPTALCALGKFGGRELGFASDLELMLVYDDRDLDAPPGTVLGDHFDHMVRGLREVIGARREGTFELDFRLRPYGKGGPPATALTSFVNYYQPGGPAWGYERQALVKFRAVAGDAALGLELEAHRDRYVYGPEPFDLEGLQHMRRLQVKQLVAPGTINAKYSPGALVDIEYFVQALQIAHGTADPTLRSTNTIEALAALGAAGRLDQAGAETLRCAYRFFRSLIDALRVVHGHARDLAVPPPGSEEFALLARRLRQESPTRLWNDLAAQLDQTRAVIERLPEYLP